MTTIYHAVERHPDQTYAEGQRKQAAHASWETLYKRGVVPVHYEKYARSSKEIGDPRVLPYLKDVLKEAILMAACSHGDTNSNIVLLSNDDTILHPDILSAVKLHLSIWGACSAQRCEIRNITPTFAPPEDYAAASPSHMGRDFFAFTVAWLRRWWDEIPDFFLGVEQWDLCLAAMVRVKVGFHSTRQNFETVIPCAELPRGYVLHLSHPTVWQHLETSPSTQHNRKLFREWSSKFLPSLAFHANGLV